MRLQLNGKPRDVDGVSTVEELIASLGIHRMIVVRTNTIRGPTSAYA